MPMQPSLTVETRIFNTADKSAPLCTLEKEINVGQFDVFPQAELAAVGIGRECGSTVLLEIIKKKTRFWLPHLWRRIQRWLRTGDD